MSFGGGFNTGTNAFSNPQSAPFGSGVFGNQSPGFGQVATTPLFNSSSSTPSTGGLFGNNPGQNLTGFGQSNATGFGGSNGLTPFGGSSSNVFGQGGSSGLSPDGSQGTYGRSFERVPENADGGSKCYMMCISAMRDFVNVQPEMLRSADYKKGHKRASGQVHNPSNQFSSPSGFGGGFRNSSFGQTGTGIFSTGSTGGGFGSSFGSGGTSFTSTGFGSSSFGNTGTSMFGTGHSTGFGSTGTGIFGNQSTGTSLFGSQQPSSFGTGFSSASTGTGLFGPSTGGSIFGQSTPAFSSGGGFTGTGLFGAQSSSGFSFGGPSGGTMTGNSGTGTSIFGQTSSVGVFGGFGQSTGFGVQSQPQGNLFGTVATSTPTGNLFGSSQPTTTQLMPTGGYFTGNRSWPSDPSTKPNWTPEFGLVVPDTTELFKIGNVSSTKVNAFDYARREREQHISNRYVSIPIKFALDDPIPEKKEKLDLSWDAFSLSRPVKTTLEDEIKESIESFRAGDAPPPSTDRRPTFTFLSPSPDPQYDRNVQALMELEKERQNRAKSVDGLSQEQLKSLLPKSTRHDYYIVPDLEGLEFLVATQGRDALKKVPGVEIGRTDFGSVCFAAPINLERLNVDDAICIRRGRVTLGEDKTALIGIPATVTLYKVFTRDKGRNGFLKAAELSEEIDRLKKTANETGDEFVSFDKHGTWVFRVSGLGR